MFPSAPPGHQRSRKWLYPSPAGRRRFSTYRSSCQTSRSLYCLEVIKGLLACLALKQSLASGGAEFAEEPCITRTAVRAERMSIGSQPVLGDVGIFRRCNAVIS